MDECALDIDNCHGLADCANTPGSFNCTCQPGYSGDGVTLCESKLYLRNSYVLSNVNVILVCYRYQ